MLVEPPDPKRSRRRIWCEGVPLPELARAEVIALLRRYAIEPIVAVRPWDLAEFTKVVRAYADAGLAFSVWPMIADAEGRWANVWNARAFRDHAMRTLDAAQAIVAPLDTMFVDLEPPIDAMRELLAGPRTALAAMRRRSSTRARARWIDGAADLAQLANAIDERGVHPSVACIPLVLLDDVDEAKAWQSLLGTPAFSPTWHRVNVMLYTSMIEGWSSGIFDRDDARAIYRKFSTIAGSRLGARAALSLGAVGVGALETEPTYRSPIELADDVATARAIGIDDLALFDLGGVLTRRPSEAWLDVFAHTPPATKLPDTTMRARIVLSLVTKSTVAWRRLL